MVKIAWHQLYAHPLPEGHRFPMLKYELIPAQLLHEGVITQDNLFAPEQFLKQRCSDHMMRDTGNSGKPILRYSRSGSVKSLSCFQYPATTGTGTEDSPGNDRRSDARQGAQDCF